MINTADQTAADCIYNANANGSPLWSNPGGGGPQRGSSPSVFSSGMTVWQSASRRKKCWAAGSPSLTSSTRLGSWNTNLGSASSFQVKSTVWVFCSHQETTQFSSVQYFIFPASFNATIL